jgi:hypothetical protein
MGSSTLERSSFREPVSLDSGLEIGVGFLRLDSDSDADPEENGFCVGAPKEVTDQRKGLVFVAISSS